ncbi:MAG: exodeoxyribonuclease VII small subunit [Deltaproteobacteria bacterium]|nr:exodeoxyribonuclease VII small subunit [Deltaproteobacteria bacterium]
MAKKQQPSSSFDEVVEQLETLVEKLESGDLNLEQALTLFERGIALSRRGQEMLDQAERRVEVLLRDGVVAPLEEQDAT